MIRDSHLSMNGGIKADSKVARVRFSCAIDSARSSIRFRPEAVIDIIVSTASLWENRKISQ